MVKFMTEIRIAELKKNVIRQDVSKRKWVDDNFKVSNREMNENLTFVATIVCGG